MSQINRFWKSGESSPALRKTDRVRHVPVSFSRAVHHIHAPMSKRVSFINPGPASLSESDRSWFQDVMQVTMKDPSRCRTFETHSGTKMIMSPNFNDPRVNQPGTVVAPFVAPPSFGAPGENYEESIMNFADFQSNPSRHPLTEADLLEYKRRVGGKSSTMYDSTRMAKLSQQVGCVLYFDKASLMLG